MSRRLRYDIPGTDFRVTSEEVREKGWPAIFGAAHGELPKLVVEIGFCRGEFLMDLAQFSDDASMDTLSLLALPTNAKKDDAPLWYDVLRTDPVDEFLEVAIAAD